MLGVIKDLYRWDTQRFSRFTLGESINACNMGFCRELTWHLCPRLTLPQVKPCFRDREREGGRDDVVTPLERLGTAAAEESREARSSRNNERTEITARMKRGLRRRISRI